jgi:hypothetical protein
MVGDPKAQVGPRNRRAALLELVESMKRAFVQDVAIDEQQRLSIVARHDGMGIPQLVDDGCWLACCHMVIRSRWSPASSPRDARITIDGIKLSHASYI